MANEAQLAEEVRFREDKCVNGLSGGVVPRQPFARLLNEKSMEWREAFLKDLESSSDDYVTILVNHGLVARGDEENHMRVHWFSKKDDGTPFSPWFPHEEDLETKLRQYMLGFITFSLSDPGHRDKPLDARWIVDPDATAVTVNWRDEGGEVVLIRTTPAPIKRMR